MNVGGFERGGADRPVGHSLAFVQCLFDDLEHLGCEAQRRVKHALLSHAQANRIAFMEHVRLDETEFVVPGFGPMTALVTGKPEAVTGYDPVVADDGGHWWVGVVWWSSVGDLTADTIGRFVGAVTWSGVRPAQPSGDRATTRRAETAPQESGNVAHYGAGLQNVRHAACLTYTLDAPYAVAWCGCAGEAKRNGFAQGGLTHPTRRGGVDWHKAAGRTLRVGQAPMNV